MLAVACANVMVDVLLWLAEMLSFSIQHSTHQIEAESDPEGEAPEEVQTLQLQQDISEWLVWTLFTLSQNFNTTTVSSVLLYLGQNLC